LPPSRMIQEPTVSSRQHSSTLPDLICWWIDRVSKPAVGGWGCRPGPLRPTPVHHCRDSRRECRDRTDLVDHHRGDLMAHRLSEAPPIAVFLGATHRLPRLTDEAFFSRRGNLAGRFPAVQWLLGNPSGKATSAIVVLFGHAPRDSWWRGTIRRPML